MDGARLRTEWGALGAEVAQELADWRAAHPRATLAEIEQVVEAAMSRWRARVLSDLVHASPAADLAGTPVGERPRCAACGSALEPRGPQERAVLTPGRPTPLRVRRSYGVCPTCGVGLFPPG